MPTTRTQKLLDKEIDFSRKDEHNNKVTIIKRWGKPDRFLDQYFNTKEKWDTLNTYNLLYVLQNKASHDTHVYKIGISTGNYRLKNYIDYNGGRTDTKPPLKMGTCSCLGIYLWYLAGQKNRLNSAKTKSKKESEEIGDTYRCKLTWNKQREAFLKQELTKNGFTKIRGYEWFNVPDERLTEFRNIIVNLTTQILKPDEKTRTQPLRSVNVDKGKQLIVATKSKIQSEKEKIRRQPARSVKKVI